MGVKWQFLIAVLLDTFLGWLPNGYHPRNQTKRLLHRKQTLYIPKNNKKSNVNSVHKKC